MTIIAQRISVSYHLAAMTKKETIEYITHRLKKAGSSSMLFSKNVINTIDDLYSILDKHLKELESRLNFPGQPMLKA